MSEQDPTIKALEKLITAEQLAELLDVEPRVVRRAARKGQIPGTIKVLGRTGFDPDLAIEWKPAPGEAAPRRADGRRPFRVYLTAEEQAALVEQGYEFVDPRAKRKARRAAKAEAAAKDAPPAPQGQGTATAPPALGSDPFADFGA